MGGHLVWEYPWWQRSFGGAWLIFLFGNFHFYVATIFVLSLKTNLSKALAVGSLYIIAIVANFVCMGLLGWVY